MAASAAVAKLKKGCNGILGMALDGSSEGGGASKAEQDRLVGEAMAAAKELDVMILACRRRQPRAVPEIMQRIARANVRSVPKISFAKAKLESGETRDINSEIEELEATIASKDALLAKSLEQVTSWEARFEKLRKSQQPLLFNSE